MEKQQRIALMKLIIFCDDNDYNLLNYNIGKGVVPDISGTATVINNQGDSFNLEYVLLSIGSTNYNIWKQISNIDEKITQVVQYPSNSEVKLIKEYDLIGQFNGKEYTWAKSNNKYGLINNRGKEITDIKYDGICLLKNKLIKVKLNNNWGIINDKGEYIVYCIYNRINDFNEGLAVVQINNNWGYINKQGIEVIPCKYDYCRDFYFGLGIVSLDSKYGVIDKFGNVKCPITFDNIYSNSNQFLRVAINGKKETYLYDININDILIEFKMVDNYLFYVKYRNKYIISIDKLIFELNDNYDSILLENFANLIIYRNNSKKIKLLIEKLRTTNTIYNICNHHKKNNFATKHNVNNNFTCTICGTTFNLIKDSSIDITKDTIHDIIHTILITSQENIYEKPKLYIQLYDYLNKNKFTEEDEKFIRSFLKISLRRFSNIKHDVNFKNFGMNPFTNFR